MTTNIYFNTIGATNGLEANGLRLANILENEVQMMLADMASIRQTSALRFMGDVAGSGSDAITARFASIGAKTPMAATADESTDVTSTLPTYSTATVTVARNALRYDISDLASLTGLGADLDPFKLAASMAQSCEARLMEIICGTFSAATSSAGTSGADMTVTDFYEAMTTLELANNFGEIYAVLHPRQLADLINSLRAETSNALAFAPSTHEAIQFKGQGFAGRLLGIDIYKSSYVALDGGAVNRVGAMFSAGGIGYAIGTPRPMIGGVDVRPAGTPCVVSMQRDESKALTEVVAHLYAGAALLESDRVVKIVTDKN